MQFILHKSSWLSATAFAFLLLSLWTVLAVNSPSGQDIQNLPQEKQASYGLTLPNIIAPLIRKEVRKEKEEEDKALACSGHEISSILGAFIRLL